ncbi:MAG: hypothetical protein ACK5JT_09285 [Hyphomicrobiaceae bacterium]
MAVGFSLTRWRQGLHFLAITLSIWIIQLGYLIGPKMEAFGGHAVVTMIGIALMALGMGAGHIIDQWRKISGVLVSYGFLIAFFGALGMQFIADYRGEYTLALGGLTLLAVVGVLAWAWRSDNRGLLWLAYAAFSFEIFALYVKKIGSLLGTSAFFMVSGLMVALLAFVAVRLHKRGQGSMEVAQ